MLIDEILGARGLKRSVVVAPHQPMMHHDARCVRRCIARIAEYFRDKRGKDVLLMDSRTLPRLSVGNRLAVVSLLQRPRAIRLHCCRCPAGGARR
jgi:flagellar biosynthesis/type III secretory pathway ATPase